MRKITIWILVLILCTSLVLSLGIRPAKTSMVSDEASTLQGTLWVVNNDKQSMNLNVYVRGEMGQFVEIEQNSISLKEEDDDARIDFTVNLPDQIPPGVSTASIVVEQQGTPSQGAISSKMLLKHKIEIQGPYPDKYVHAKLNFHENDERIEFVSEVNNLGKKSLDSVQTNFYVNSKKIELQSQQESLQSKETTFLKADVDKEIFDEGEYEVSAITTYDGAQVEVVKKLQIGNPEVEITYFDKYFTAGKINEYTLELLNKWNQPIENVFVDVLVNKDGERIDEFRTTTIDLPALAREQLKDYFDARQKDPGEYSFDLVVNFFNSFQMESKKFQVELLEQQDFEQISQDNENAIVGNAIKDVQVEQEENTDQSVPLGWIIAGVLVLLAAAYVLYRYINKDEYEGDDMF